MGRKVRSSDARKRRLSDFSSASAWFGQLMVSDGFDLLRCVDARRELLRNPFDNFKTFTLVQFVRDVLHHALESLPILIECLLPDDFASLFEKTHGAFTPMPRRPPWIPFSFAHFAAILSEAS